MIMRGGGSTDKELLDHYIHERDSAAFGELVVRYGPAVRRVCRGVLADAHEAEDAFQATFLLLARKAPGIQDPEALGGWLRGVAYRVAIRARRQAAQRRAIQQAWAERSAVELNRTFEEPARELREVVGDELARLPDDYRRTIVLCYFDGLTHREAARRMNCPIGTVKVRLARGRRLLRERLNRRGVALGAGLVVMLAPSRRAPTVAATLAKTTARAMDLEAAGRRAEREHEDPRAHQLAERLVLIPGLRWLFAALVVAAVSVTLTVPVTRVLTGPPVPEVDPSTLPSNLTDVLNVECR
jgi:RNA polymerase sigma factor (sigma-70 family)